MVSFAVQKLLSIIRSHLFTFAFVSIILEEGYKKKLLQYKSKSVLTRFASRNFMISGLTFKSFFNPLLV